MESLALKETRYTHHKWYNRLPFTLDLEEKLSFFLDNGMLDRVPTKWQVLQGEVEMLPYVVLPFDDDDERYKDTSIGKHKLLRTALLAGYTYGGHLRAGTGLAVNERDLQKHLLGVFHLGQPVYDLQLLQTYPRGLENLERRIHILNEPLEKLHADKIGSTRSRLRLEKRFLESIVPQGYHDQLLVEIERAKELDYDPAHDTRRPEFWSLVGLMDYCATHFPANFTFKNAPKEVLGMLKRFYGGAKYMVASYKNRKLLKEMSSE